MTIKEKVGKSLAITGLVAIVGGLGSSIYGFADRPKMSTRLGHVYWLEDQLSSDYCIKLKEVLKNPNFLNDLLSKYQKIEKTYRHLSSEPQISQERILRQQKENHISYSLCLMILGVYLVIGGRLISPPNKRREE